MIVHAFEDPAQAAVLATLATVLDARGGAVDDAQLVGLGAIDSLVRVDRSVTPARADLVAVLADERALVAARVALARTALRAGGFGVAAVPAPATAAAPMTTPATAPGGTGRHHQPARGLRPVAGATDDGGLGAALGVADRLFAVGLYFEVHEVLEPVWQRLEGVSRRFLQGLIQVAVGLHHLAHARPGSAATLLAAAREKLAGAPPRSAGVDVPGLVAALEPWERYARTGLPAWPETLVLPALLAPPR
jgi:hypothetical protein